MLSRSGRAERDDDVVQSYADKQVEMQRSMMSELDRRRNDWEHEMHRMQEDFFKVTLSKRDLAV